MFLRKKFKLQYTLYVSQLRILLSLHYEGILHNYIYIFHFNVNNVQISSQNKFPNLLHCKRQLTDEPSFYLCVSYRIFFSF